MSEKVSDETKDESETVAAPVGWLRLSSSMMNNEDLMIGSSPGSIEFQCH